MVWGNCPIKILWVLRWLNIFVFLLFWNRWTSTLITIYFGVCFPFLQSHPQCSSVSIKHYMNHANIVALVALLLHSSVCCFPFVDVSNATMQQEAKGLTMWTSTRSWESLQLPHWQRLPWTPALWKHQAEVYTMLDRLQTYGVTPFRYFSR